MAGRSQAPQVTIHDVADRAGVSIATVSRVLNGSRPVARDLAERVRAAADELGYRANLLGRALRQGRSHSIGLVVPDLENPFFATLAQQVSRSFSRVGVEVLISSADNDLEIERRAVGSFLGRQVDGLVLIPCDETHSAATVRMASRSVVTVQLDRLARSVRTHYVGCDNTYGMGLVAEHVLSTRGPAGPVLFIGARPSSSTAHERLDAFARAFPDSRRLLGTFSFEFGRTAMHEAIAGGLRGGVVVTGADVIALGVLAALHARRLSVPEQFRVIGFDDAGVSMLAQPALTTVRQDVDAMCAAIAEIVQAALEHPQSADVLVARRFRPSLVVRETSPPATDGVKS